MERKVVFPCPGDQGYVKFAVLSYVISVLLVFSGSAIVWAEAPTTAKVAFMSKAGRQSRNLYNEPRRKRADQFDTSIPQPIIVQRGRRTENTYSRSRFQF